MYCKFCNKSISTTDKFCPNCGMRLTLQNNAANQQSYAQIKACKVCGSLIHKSVVYCPECHQLADNPPRSNQSETNGFAIAGFICAFFFPILGLIFGCLGLTKAKQCGVGKAFSLAAIRLSIVFMIVNVVLILVYFSYLSRLLPF
ncbi:MAG: DUF4190 domain-containing protein [Clostridia bacterium]|nr:DUF4190 domain-containing protein [Clostridia bacterium]